MVDEKDPASAAPAAYPSTSPEMEKAADLDAKLTVRERRALHAKQQARKELPMDLVRKSIGPGIVILILAGVATGFYFTAKNQGDCPGHWHATFAIYVDGQRVVFPQPPYELSPRGDLPMSMHMHSPSQEILHFEPTPSDCRGTKSTFDLLDVGLTSTKLTLDGAHASGPMGGTYENEGNRTLQYFLQSRDGDMQKVTWGKLDNRQLANGEKLLIAFGNYTDAEVQAMMGRIATPP